jgi:hypothetical protein
MSVFVGQPYGAHSFDVHSAEVHILSNASGDNLGQALAADLNGDGIDEIIVGGGADYGHGIAKFNIIWGRRDWSPTPRTIDLATTRGALYIQSLTDHEFAWTGFQTYMTAGDFDGDGRDDVAFGGWHNDLAGVNNGCIYLLKGRDAYTPNVRNFAPQYFDATFLGGHTGGNYGYAVAMGDLNGDGKDELLGLAPNAHAVLCVFGSNSLPDHFQRTLTTANADLVFQGSRIGGQVLAVGDFNGDGRDDVALGSRNEIRIYYSTADLLARRFIDVDVTTPNLTITGRTNSMIRAGDVNHDGLADLIGLTDGVAYVVFGAANWAPGTIRDAGGLVADLSFSIEGAYDEWDTVEVADFDGDSFGDLLLHEGYSRKSWVVRSQPDFPPNHYINLATNPNAAYFFYQSGYSMDAAGDFNGDGRADLIAPVWDEYNNYGGEAYVVFTPPSDLAVENFDFSPSIRKPGEAISFSGRVANRGLTGTGKAFWIEFVVRPYQDSGPVQYLCDSVHVGPIGPDQSVELSSYPRTLYTLPGGSYQVGIQIDPLDSVAETDETNNRLWLETKSLTVGLLSVRGWEKYADDRRARTADHND